MVVFQAQKISSGMEVTDIVFPSTDNVISREAQIRLPASLLIARGTNGEERDNLRTLSLGAVLELICIYRVSAS